jgi:hypothetical protein
MCFQLGSASKGLAAAACIAANLLLASHAVAGLSPPNNSGSTLSYAEQPVSDVNDRNFNRFWPDKINFVDWTSAHPARIYSSMLPLPDGRRLTVTMLGGNNDNDCDVNACSMRLFDGNDMVGELSVCEDMSRHQVADDRITLIACGKSYNLLEATAEGDAARHDAETTMLHNGSVVAISREHGDDVVIKYLSPRRGLPGTLKGQVLFRGSESKTHQFGGTAYVFKNGCPAAPYQVSGTLDANGELVLSGQAPLRDAKSCAVLGYSTQSPNAKLVFANILPPD